MCGGRDTKTVICDTVFPSLYTAACRGDRVLNVGLMVASFQAAFARARGHRNQLRERGVGRVIVCLQIDRWGSHS